jgi:hypothetical protein
MSTETIEEKLARIERALKGHDDFLRLAPERIAEQKKRIANLETSIKNFNNFLSTGPANLKPSFQMALDAETEKLNNEQNVLQLIEKGVVDIETVKRPADLKTRQELLQLKAAANKAAANKKAKENAAAGGAGKPADGLGKKPDDPDAPATEAKPLLPWWAWLLIAVAVLIFLVAIFAAVARKRQAEENNYAAQSFYPRNSDYAY